MLVGLEDLALKGTLELLKIADRGVLGSALAGVTARERDVERKFSKFGDDSNLKAFCKIRREWRLVEKVIVDILLMILYIMTIM